MNYKRSVVGLLWWNIAANTRGLVMGLCLGAGLVFILASLFGEADS